MVVLRDDVTSPGTSFVVIVVVDDCSVVRLVPVPGVVVVRPLAGLVCTDAVISPDCVICTMSSAEVVASSSNDSVVLAVPGLGAPGDCVTCTNRVDDTMFSAGRDVTRPTVDAGVVVNICAVVSSPSVDDVVMSCLFDGDRSVTDTVTASPLGEVVFFDKGTDVDGDFVMTLLITVIFSTSVSRVTDSFNVVDVTTE